MRDRGYRFGPVVAEGSVRFRLWAPAAATVALVLAPGDRDERVLAMTAEGGGWHELLVDGAGPGTRYLFDVGGLRVPDPASRYQPRDVLGPSEVVDTAAFRFETADWRGRPWHETVLYELHVGTFSAAGDFAGIEARLDHLAALGVTAVELMPVADFAGERNWGYDGVLLFAPDSAYGRPEDLVRLIDAAHARGLMVFLDVVYNHFGPEGNFLGAYAPPFFSDERQTPWGEAIDFRHPEIRRFFTENVLFWLETYQIDGLRFDAVNAIEDLSRPHILTELAGVVRAELEPERHVHLVLENDDNEAHRLARSSGGRAVRYDAQWNDDFHRVVHHLVTGEAEGYYADYVEGAVERLARALATGFVYQGEPVSFRDGRARGEPSGHLPPTAFVNFIQNHDQVGNRAWGERLAVLSPPDRRACLAAILLLAPMPPMLFMGEEWASEQPFLYFTDFPPDLAAAVRAGRHREFARYAAFADPAARASIPDPNAASTFENSKLDWDAAAGATGQWWLERHRALLHLRRTEIVPLIPAITGAVSERPGDRSILVTWSGAAGALLTLAANVGEAPAAISVPAGGRLIHASAALPEAAPNTTLMLPAWTAVWWVQGDTL